MPFYVVFAGRKRGIVREWDDCKALVDGFPNNEHKRYNTWNEAQAAFLARCRSPDVWEMPDDMSSDPQGRMRIVQQFQPIKEKRGGTMNLVIYGNFLFISGLILGFALCRLMM